MPSIAGTGRAGRSTLTCTGTVHRAATADSAASRPRSVRTAGWMPRARSRSSCSAILTSPCASLDHAPRAACRVLQQLLLGQAQVHGQGDQPGLRPVVQVALDPAQVGGGGVDHDPPVRLQLA